MFNLLSSFSEVLFSKQKFWITSVVLMVLTYVCGYGILLMDVDAGQYASMSREMAETNQFLEVTNRLQPYLDKPPLLFWLSAIAIKIFGEHDWAYRIPTLLAILLASWSTYKLARFYYNETIAKTAGLMLLSCQAMFLTSHDCRTDTLLLAAVTFAIWQIEAYLRFTNAINFYLGCIGITAALLTKGPIGLVVPVVAFSADWAIKKQWRHFFRIEWLSALVIVLALLAPMTYGLYQQWGWKGVRFFYWTQSFGRITGESEWDNDVDITFLFTNLLWSYLPWTPWFLYGIFLSAKELFAKKAPQFEFLSLIGFLVPMLMLSTSRYQLPHYSYVLLGLISILAAKGFYSASVKLGWYFASLLYAVGLILLGLSYFVTDINTVSLVIASAILIWIGIRFVTDQFFKDNASTLLRSLLLSICTANVILNLLYYPSILQYQASTKALEIIKDKKIPIEDYVTFDFESHAADFYRGGTIPNFVNTTDLKLRLEENPNVVMLIREKDINRLDSLSIIYETVAKLNHYHVTKLTIPFLNKATRLSVTEPCQLIRTTKVGLASNRTSIPDFLTKAQH